MDQDGFDASLCSEVPDPLKLRAFENGGGVAVMRRYFLERATSLGYGAIDMDRHFLPEHENNGTRFEFPTDDHWNAVGHRLAAEAVIGTDLFEKMLIPSNGL